LDFLVIWTIRILKAKTIQRSIYRSAQYGVEDRIRSLSEFSFSPTRLPLGCFVSHSHLISQNSKLVRKLLGHLIIYQIIIWSDGQSCLIWLLYICTPRARPDLAESNPTSWLWLDGRFEMDRAAHFTASISVFMDFLF
jgi:hypothetical protein